MNSLVLNSSKQASANAAFGFATDLVNLQRSVGKYYMLLGDGERENFKGQVESNE